MTNENKFLSSKHPTLIKVMDLLIPSIDNMPGAGSMGLIIELEKLCKKYEIVYLSIKRIINAIELDPISRANGSFLFMDQEKQIEIIETIELNLSEDFSIFLNGIYSIYYMDKNVKKRINWGYNSIQPQGFEIKPWDESILDKIKKRKPFWKNIEN